VIPPVRWSDLFRRLWALVAIVAIAGVLLMAMSSRCHAGDDVPSWVMTGMLKVESSSYYDDGKIVYVNQKRGKAGEVGAFQAMPSTLRRFGFSPSLFECDVAYCERATRAILTHYFARTGNWTDAVACWHRPNDFRSSKAKEYADRVRAAGIKAN
jgi:hypothetical protein